VRVTCRSDVRRVLGEATAATLVFGFGSGVGEDVEEDSDNVTDEQPGSAEDNHCLHGGEPEPITERHRCRKAERPEDKGY